MGVEPRADFRRVLLKFGRERVLAFRGLLGCRRRCQVRFAVRSMPVRRFACTAITGTPNRFSSAAISISMSRSRAKSTMFSATTVGSPSENTWLTRYRLRSRLLASTIERITSGVSLSLPAQEHVDGHHLIRRPRRQTIRARQIDQLEHMLAMPHRAGLLLDRNARIIPHTLPHPSQRT